ncbi:uncharacterized protein E0L32_009917 [Thyridium curvatum]|uniref:Uncharacterized protein n=1 Tax=Thyridium curvatum TaxID=1093900 RepID=A0A507AUP1_9PEZI|nr:uncharacterized protein E0L32_009917 [Thyridium curvatum]TPX08578.1 hypothetical protein E0L32_009917 [Thyridium curvatum]
MREPGTGSRPRLQPPPPRADFTSTSLLQIRPSAHQNPVLSLLFPDSPRTQPFSPARTPFQAAIQQHPRTRKRDMSCGSGCSPHAGFPDPNQRVHPGGSDVNGHRRHASARRPTFFSRRLARASDVLSDPLRISFRELVLVALALFALYHGFFAARTSRDLLAVQPVAALCGPSLAPWGCAVRLFWMHFAIARMWVGAVVPWAFVAAAAVFVGEEVIRAVKRQGKK